MSDIAIRIEGLGKRYRIGKRQAAYRTLREAITETLARPFRRAKELLHGERDGDAPLGGSIWALKDVSFEVKHGEVIGIIGRNGAGKSTLLKILSQITDPTEGVVTIYGRVGALLEVGTGFHTELTGRENVYLNGAILGMRQAEIKRKFDEIVAFAEVEKFIDTPVKHYSSGMHLRLAFAVAAHLEPEIIIVDEVLAVGDVGFQNKCMGKMGDVVREGRTVLFVSHNMAAVQHLCKRVLILDQGKVAYEGACHTGVQRYMEISSVPTRSEMDLTRHPNRKAGSLPLLRAIRLLDRYKTPKDRFTTGEMMTIELTFDPVRQFDNPQFGIGVGDGLGTSIFSVATYLSNCQLPRLQDQCIVTCSIEEIPLAAGRYTLSLSAGTVENPILDALEYAISFEVEEANFYGNGRLSTDYSTDLGKVVVRSRWEAKC